MTLGTTSMASGLAFIYSKGTPIMIDGSFLDIGNGFLFRVIPLPAVYFIVILVIVGLALRYTVFGRFIYSIGSNLEATRLSGVNVTWTLIKVYMLSGLLAAIGGIIYASQLGIGQPIAGAGYEIKAITAVIVGGASMTGGVGTLFGTFLGTAIIGILGNIMNLTGVNPFVQTFLTGVILILAVLIRKDR
jgi:ribose/xylose/arabinose/galactoside ABC-type transport system permease subunit